MAVPDLQPGDHLAEGDTPQAVVKLVQARVGEAGRQVGWDQQRLYPSLSKDREVAIGVVKVLLLDPAVDEIGEADAEGDDGHQAEEGEDADDGSGASGTKRGPGEHHNPSDTRLRASRSHRANGSPCARP